jgi:hypothetical protein
MKPILMRSLGATAPSRPSADAGIIVGIEQAAPRAMEDRLRNWRREIGFEWLIIGLKIRTIDGTTHALFERSAGYPASRDAFPHPCFC